jgi:biopolymer transport protein ExbD
MAEALEDLEAALVRLRKAKRSGTLIVRHGDTSVTYRSMAEITEAINEVLGEIAKLNGTTRGPRYVVQTGKGH